MVVGYGPCKVWLCVDVCGLEELEFVGGEVEFVDGAVPILNRQQPLPVGSHIGHQNKVFEPGQVVGIVEVSAVVEVHIDNLIVASHH